MRVITLYANRKYYDKGLHGYVDLLDILQAVKEGDDFIVRSHKTGQDITNKTINAAIYKYLVIPEDIARDLVQSLYEAEVEKQNFLPKANDYDRL